MLNIIEPLSQSVLRVRIENDAEGILGAPLLDSFSGAWVKTVMSVNMYYWSPHDGRTWKCRWLAFAVYQIRFVDMDNAVEHFVKLVLVFCFVLSPPFSDEQALLCCISLLLPLCLIQDLNPMPIHPSLL